MYAIFNRRNSRAIETTRWRRIQLELAKSWTYEFRSEIDTKCPFISCLMSLKNIYVHYNFFAFVKSEHRAALLPNEYALSSIWKLLPHDDPKERVHFNCDGSIGHHRALTYLAFKRINWQQARDIPLNSCIGLHSCHVASVKNVHHGLFIEAMLVCF